MHLSPGVLYESNASNIPVSYFVSDEWPSAWQTPEDVSAERLKTAIAFGPTRWLYRALAKVLGTGCDFPRLRIHHGQFASEFLRKSVEAAAIPVECDRVVNWGVERDEYVCRRNWQTPARRFLFAGQISEHKGVHTGIAAFAVVAKALPELKLELSLVGAVRDSDYEMRLKDIIERNEVSEKVHWLGKLGERDLQRVYQSHDAFLFTSVWNEPFSISLVEAMTAGMVVVSTVTGGTGEIVQNEVNALTFEVDDVSGCARQMERVACEQSLCGRLSQAAEASTLNLTLTSMVTSIEQRLEDAIHSCRDFCSVGTGHTLSQLTSDAR